MKQVSFKIATILVVLALFFACAKTEFEPIPQDQLMGDSLQTTYTIQQLITEFDTDSDAYSDTVSYKGGLFTVKKIVSAQPVVISGVVTSTDVEGNVYKFLTVQETTPNGLAIKISVDMSGLSATYPLGQRVWIQCNDLVLGKYAQSYQIGVKYINLTKSKLKKSSNTTIYRVEPGRIPPPIAKKVIHSFGLPNPALIKVDTMTIAQIKAAGPNIINKLICIKNAYFTGKGANNGYTANISNEELIFAPSTNGVGYPQSREIQDGTGSLFISTSEFSKFAKNVLPTSNYKGNITAILGWYNDKELSINLSKIYHQLTLRRISDLGKGFEEYHLNNK
jgi:hypothetical protein